MTTDPTELCANFWAYVSPVTGLVQRVAGRLYALTGTEEDRYAVLQALAPTDFAASPWTPVPESMVLDVEFIEEPLRGVVRADLLADPRVHEQVFRPVLDMLVETLPRQMRMVDGVPTEAVMPVPDSLLHVTTNVFEYDDGGVAVQVRRC